MIKIGILLALGLLGAWWFYKVARTPGDRVTSSSLEAILPFFFLVAGGAGVVMLLFKIMGK